MSYSVYFKIPFSATHTHTHTHTNYIFRRVRISFPIKLFVQLASFNVKHHNFTNAATSLLAPRNQCVGGLGKIYWLGSNRPPNSSWRTPHTSLPLVGIIPKRSYYSTAGTVLHRNSRKNSSRVRRQTIVPYQKYFPQQDGFSRLRRSGTRHTLKLRCLNGLICGRWKITWKRMRFRLMD
jgi:hypothetical protein